MAPEAGTTRRKRALPRAAADAPPASGADEEAPTATKKRRLNGGEPSSGGPAAAARGRPAVSRHKLAQTAKKQPAEKKKATAKAAGKSVYDVPSSGDELEPRGEAVEQEQQQQQEEEEVEVPKKRPRGRPRKVVTAAAEEGGSKKPAAAASKPLKTRAIGRTMAKMASKDDVDEIDPSTWKPAVKSMAQRRTKAAEAAQPPPPKGILTPRHKRPGRPPKSVAFNSGDKRSAEVFFEDLPSKGKGKGQAKKTAEPEEEEEDESEEGEDDEVCVICSKPDSKPPNEIIFCENCDKAFHQKCYNVPVIPEDDWFCRDCLQEDVVPETKTTSSGPRESAVVSAEVPDIPNFEQHLQTMQRILVDRCSGSRRLNLRGQDEAYEKVFQLVEQTVLAGEGNSMMVIGARGCGKTLLVETVMSELSKDSRESFHVVRLNGFIHTDDKLALKEIWRQLGKEMELEDDLVNKTSNYADTLASLLALLSHPAEITGTDDGVTSKSVVFVIDEFDLFATHARQTLLYNLFDIAQARKAPIAVLGLTTRIDVVESLEKRVKSRFSHRYVHLSLPKSLPAYWDICKQGLLVEEEDMESEGFDVGVDGADRFLNYWDRKIEALHKTTAFQDHLEYFFYTTKSVGAFLTTCILPLTSLTAGTPNLRIPAPGSASLEAPDSKLHLLSGLSDLDLALLVAAARLDIIAHTDTVNFAMAYDEYSSQMGKQRVQSASSGMLALGAGGRVWGRALAGMAWERLVTLGLLIPAGIGGKSNAAHGGLEGKMWKLDVALDEIPAVVDLPGYLVKWCTQI